MSIQHKEQYIMSRVLARTYESVSAPISLDLYCMTLYNPTELSY